MSKEYPKALEQDSSSINYHLLSPDLPTPNEEEKNRYINLIQIAKKANSNPVDSGFHVKAAAYTRLSERFDIYVPGGNKEIKGKNFAYVHGEIAAVTSLRDSYGDTPITAIGFYFEGDLLNGPNLTPCGPCRDVLKQECEPETVILNGNDREITIRKMQDLFFSDYQTVDPESLDGRGINAAQRAFDQAVTIYLPDEEKENIYGIALVGEHNSCWRGSFFTTAAYGAVHPGVAAVQNWRNSTDYAEAQYFRGDLTKIVVVGKNSIPEVSYTDRQTLAEFDEELRSANKRTEPLRVELISTDGNRQILEAALSDTEEMLPHRFGPGSLGKEKELKDQHLKLFPNMLFHD